MLKIATKSQAEFNRVSHCQQYKTNQFKNKEQDIAQNLIYSHFHSHAETKAQGVLIDLY